MKQGFLVVAENNNNIDFIKMAYVLALSLKSTQKQIKNLSILTTDTITEPKYIKAFNQIIVMDKDNDWKNKSKSLDTTSLCAKYYDVTPYDETIVLDTDVIFTQDISSWWNILSKQDLIFTTQVKTFRGNNTKGDYYRKVFTKNYLPNIYTGMFYFKKSETAALFFKTVNIIFDNWIKFYNKVLDEYKPDFLSADLAYAIAYKLLNLPDYSYLKIPTFTHMKTRLQDIGKIKEEWTEFLNISINDNLDLKINNYSQKFPFHYHDKNFLTEEIIEAYEKET